MACPSAAEDTCLQIELAFELLREFALGPEQESDELVKPKLPDLFVAIPDVRPVPVVMERKRGAVDAVPVRIESDEYGTVPDLKSLHVLVAQPRRCVASKSASLLRVGTSVLLGTFTVLSCCNDHRGHWNRLSRAKAHANRQTPRAHDPESRASRRARQSPPLH